MKGNDNIEIENFKRIDFVNFVLSNGYKILESKDSKNWRVVYSEFYADQLIIHRYVDSGFYFYFNIYDSGDKGTIIDFLKNRNKFNLGQVRVFLRKYEPNSNQVYKGQKPLKKFNYIKSALSDLSYLLFRGLNDQTINHAAFKNKVLNNIVFDIEKKIEYINIAFPLLDENNLIIGLEQRNTVYNQITKNDWDYKNIEGAKGLWVSNPTIGEEGGSIDNLFIFESAIDAMSYHQLYNEVGSNNIYVSTAGSFSEKQLNILQKLIYKIQPKIVCLGNDNDLAGIRFNINYLGQLINHTNLKNKNNNHQLLRIKLLLNGENKCKIIIKTLAEKWDIIKENDFINNQQNNWYINYLLDNIVDAECLINNNRESLIPIIDFIKSIKSLEQFKISFPNLKDFNDDLMALLTI